MAKHALTLYDGTEQFWIWDSENTWDFLLSFFSVRRFFPVSRYTSKWMNWNSGMETQKGTKLKLFRRCEMWDILPIGNIWTYHIIITCVRFLLMIIRRWVKLGRPSVFEHWKTLCPIKTTWSNKKVWQIWMHYNMLC